MAEEMNQEVNNESVAKQEEVKQWYVVNTYAGHENRVKSNLEKRIESMGLQNNLFRIVVAEEVETEVKNGKTKEEVKNIFPGYLFVEMIMSDEAWYVVRNTPGVTGFIGSSGGGAKPFPVKEEEMDKILRTIGQSDKKLEVDYGVGDHVKVLSGPFAGMEGVVDSMNDTNEIATILLIIFGRETPTDVKYVDLIRAD